MFLWQNDYQSPKVLYCWCTFALPLLLPHKNTFFIPVVFLFKYLFSYVVLGLICSAPCIFYCVHVVLVKIKGIHTLVSIDRHCVFFSQVRWLSFYWWICTDNHDKHMVSNTLASRMLICFTGSEGPDWWERRRSP